jgi:hypothetical protein
MGVVTFDFDSYKHGFEVVCTALSLRSVLRHSPEYILLILWAAYGSFPQLLLALLGGWLAKKLRLTRMALG